MQNKKSTIHNISKMSSMNIVRKCAAGSGKTYEICRESSENQQKVLIVTYTTRGIETIKSELQSQNKGVIPSHITILSWYEFILRELIKPYQTCLFGINQIKGLRFDLIHKSNFIPKKDKKHYLQKSDDLRAETAAELACFINNETDGKPIERLERIYRYIYIDEVQDLAGYDLDLILLLLQSSINVTLVDDEKQASFTTNPRTKNKQMAGKNIWKFFDPHIKSGLVIEEKSLKSSRCNSTICSFANSIYPSETPITSIMTLNTGHDGVYIIYKDDLEKYIDCYHPTILRYNTKTDCNGYPGYNFGECKGMTFGRILIFPNKMLIKYIVDGTPIDHPEKYYIAITRAKHSVAIVMDSFTPSFQYLSCEISIENGSINGYSYCPDNRI